MNIEKKMIKAEPRTGIKKILRRERVKITVKPGTDNTSLKCERGREEGGMKEGERRRKNKRERDRERRKNIREREREEE